MGQIFSSSSSNSKDGSSSSSSSNSNNNNDSLSTSTADVAAVVSVNNNDHNDNDNHHDNSDNGNQLELHELMLSSTTNNTTSTTAAPCHSPSTTTTNTTTIVHQNVTTKKKKKKGFVNDDDDDDESLISSSSSSTCDDTAQLSFDDSSFSSSLSEASSAGTSPTVKIGITSSTIQDCPTGVADTAAAQKLTAISTHINTAELMLVQCYFYGYATTTTSSSSTTTAESWSPPPLPSPNSRYHRHLLPMAVSHLTEAAKSIAYYLHHHCQNNPNININNSNVNSDGNNLNGDGSAFLHSALLVEWYRVYYNALWISNHHHHSLESSEQWIGARSNDGGKEYNNTTTAAVSSPSSSSAAAAGSSPMRMGPSHHHKNKTDRSPQSHIRWLESAALDQSVGVLFVWLGDHRLALDNFRRAERQLLQSPSDNTTVTATATSAAVAPLRTIVPCLVNIAYSCFALNDYVETIQAGKQALNWIRILVPSTATTMATADNHAPHGPTTLVAGHRHQQDKELLLAHHLSRVIGQSYERLGDYDTADSYYNYLY
eukprot:CAMPEP_0113495164 /NCGR_PEP_ID=MMETSP0014_2-20120614/29474_1 /TAXON_ID=2857 /ORGANISM="Nitzschia sp." /LENGTH=542 /DNA_ID=CAMNT_0000389065 /DNA_START=192 /DNA_END=1820 /DNA_ORIENTATION=- /assembly_acc=CAM_ASM_000159